MPGRQFNSGDYRFGFNGTEKVPEMNNGHNTTFYREQDTRIARWWSIDPKTREFESPYAMIGNNPILYFDVLGDTLDLNPGDKQAAQDVKDLAGEYDEFVQINENRVSIDESLINKKANEIASSYKKERKGRKAKNKFLKGIDNDLGVSLLRELSADSQKFLYGTKGTIYGRERKDLSIINRGLGLNFPNQPSGETTIKNNYFFNLSKTPYKAGFGHYLPSEGYDGEVWVAGGTYYERVWKTNFDTEKVFREITDVARPRFVLVYHELLENMQRTKYGKFYDAADAYSVNKANGTRFEIISVKETKGDGSEPGFSKFIFNY